MLRPDQKSPMISMAWHCYESLHGVEDGKQ